MIDALAQDTFEQVGYGVTFLDLLNEGLRHAGPPHPAHCSLPATAS